MGSWHKVGLSLIFDRFQNPHRYEQHMVCAIEHVSQKDIILSTTIALCREKLSTRVK